MKTAMLAALIVLAGCTNPEDATRILRGAGYTNVEMTGYRWFACSKDDTFHSGFRAKGPVGTPVSGTVCAGLLFKNSTIRLD